MKFLNFIGMLALMLALLMCVSCSTHKPIDSGAISESSQTTKTVAKEPQFTLGPGDNIKISVWRNDDLDRTVTLDPSGKIIMPLAGAINASGMTVSQLNKEITSRLGKYIKDPFVDVNIISITSRKIYVLGEVRSPGTFSHDRQVPVWEAVSQAGGFTDDANEKNLLLVRVKNGVAKISIVDLDFNKIYEKGMIKGDYYLKDGDILYVPERKISSVEAFMVRINNIIAPIYTLQKMITIWPNLIDAINNDSHSNTVLPVN